MKILVVSDTHGQLKNFKVVLKKAGKADRLFHLGDVCGQEQEIRRLADCPVEMIGGNNDAFSDLPREKTLTVGKYQALLTHGHAFQVTLSTDRLVHYAASIHCQLVFFGHTHKALIQEKDGIMLMNPGSLTYPRGEEKRPSYLILEVDEAGEVRAKIHYL